MDNKLLSFVELKSTELENFPITPGEIIFTTDTQRLYHTTLEGIRQEISTVSIVKTLPENPIENHLYIIPTGITMGLYIYIDNKWVKMSFGSGESGGGGIIASETEPLGQPVGGTWFILTTGEEDEFY